MWGLPSSCRRRSSWLRTRAANVSTRMRSRWTSAARFVSACRRVSAIRWLMSSRASALRYRLERGIPAVFLTTGLHPDYHTPDDDTGRLDFPKLERITELAARLAWLAAEGDAPRFAAPAPLH